MWCDAPFGLFIILKKNPPPTVSSLSHSRAKEAPLKNLQQIVARLVQAMEVLGFVDDRERPLVLFGHSFGAMQASGGLGLEWGVDPVCPGVHAFECVCLCVRESQELTYSLSLTPPQHDTTPKIESRRWRSPACCAPRATPSPTSSSSPAAPPPTCVPYLSTEDQKQKRKKGKRPTVSVL